MKLFQAILLTSCWLLTGATAAFAQGGALLVAKEGETPSSNSIEIRTKGKEVVSISADLFEGGEGKRIAYGDTIWVIECGSYPDSVCLEPDWVARSQGRSYQVPNPMGPEIKIVVHYVGAGARQEATVLLINEEDPRNAHRAPGQSLTALDDSDSDYDAPSSRGSRSWGSGGRGASAKSSSGSSSHSYGGGGSSRGSRSGRFRNRSRDWDSDGDSNYSASFGRGGRSSGSGGGPNTKAWGYNRDNETPVLSCTSKPNKEGKMEVTCDDGSAPKTIVKALRIRKSAKPKPVVAKVHRKKLTPKRASTAKSGRPLASKSQ